MSKIGKIVGDRVDDLGACFVDEADIGKPSVRSNFSARYCGAAQILEDLMKRSEVVSNRSSARAGSPPIRVAGWSESGGAYG
jgi:hypothetical protein